MIEYFGITATILFCIATGVQACKSMYDGHSKGISHGLIWMVLIGFFLMTIYVIDKVGYDLILLSSYGVQGFLWAIIAKYKYFERDDIWIEIKSKKK